MLEVISLAFFWIFFLYGIHSFTSELLKVNTYKKIKEKIKIIMIAKDVEEGIESYIREISFGKNFYNNLVFIDNNSEDDTFKILYELQKEEFNIKVLNDKEGKEYLSNIIK